MTVIVTTIGLDLAKSVFQIHGADCKGRPLLKKRLRMSAAAFEQKKFGLFRMVFQSYEQQ